jgi:serine/threonine protein kinase
MKQALRSEASDIRKAHISLDIALGLATLHPCGFVHGDVKPGNILLYEHAKRGIIAKLSDFCGSASVSLYWEEDHRVVGSAPWLPPEVLLYEDDIDWLKSDTYSFGLIIGTLWARKGYLVPGYSFLSMNPLFHQDDLPLAAKKDLEICFKCVIDGEQGSVQQLAISVTTKMSEEEPSGNVMETELPLASIIRSSLSSMQSRRAEVKDILEQDFEAFAIRTQRVLDIVK